MEDPTEFVEEVLLELDRVCSYLAGLQLDPYLEPHIRDAIGAKVIYLTDRIEEFNTKLVSA